jgi:hypothetical protein
VIIFCELFHNVLYHSKINIGLYNSILRICHGRGCLLNLPQCHIFLFVAHHKSVVVFLPNILNAKIIHAEVEPDGGTNMLP